ncbi:MAG: phosphoribosyltransferase, partial [Candidatus Levybacteria bacterium]|nr:phosphoribosyltransferase [Candidatus Levybacteria bacterium]
VASILELPLDIIVVKKIGALNNPELAIGAVGPGNAVYWDKDLIERLGVSKVESSKFKVQSSKERKEREKALRKERGPINAKEKAVILVDDGVATGATVMAAQKALEKMGAARVILAIPVISKETLNDIKRYFDKVIALSVEEEFYAVGQFYKEFPQVTDQEVIKLLEARD